MVCPKCGVPIKRFDLSPNCKQCGVHILYYTQEEDLARDAKKCELEFAKMRVFLEKIKLAFIKDRLALARMILILLGVGCLFIPFAKISADLPFWSADITLSGWGIYQMISNGLLMQLPNILQADIAGDLTGLLLAVTVIFVATVLPLLGIFATWLLGFLNFRKSCRVMGGFCAAAGVLCIAGAVAALILQSKAAAYSLFSASAGAGFFIMAIPVFALLAVNILLYRKNPQPQAKPIDLERTAILAKVKAGEVSLDDLSLPVCYSAEEELARTQILGNSKKKKKKGGAGNG